LNRQAEEPDGPSAKPKDFRPVVDKNVIHIRKVVDICYCNQQASPVATFWIAFLV
jgi:hypothetical protein